MDFDSAYAAATRVAGVSVLERRIVVRAAGDDRVAFFHGMCSADLKGAAAGDMRAALLLTEHAHVIADLFIWVAADALLLELEAGAWPRVRAHLEKLIVADDVEFEETNLSVIDVEGPRALDASRLLGAPDVQPWKFVRADEACVANLPRFGALAVSVLAPRDRTGAIVARILGAIDGARAIDEAVLDTIRIEHGVARVGVDTADKTIALEARLEHAISFNKGCYLGQETIERATARGHLKKRMYGLRFSGPAPATGAVLTSEGKEVGRVSSVADSPRLGAIGLAILHHSAWRAGAELKVAGGGGAIVSELPFRQD